jgi:LysR family hydrogen peroxide-inducible transcriptional activator
VAAKGLVLYTVILMTLTELKYIVAVARSTSAARPRPAMSSPLSVAVKKLEEELDVKLFERSASARSA